MANRIRPMAVDAFIVALCFFAAFALRYVHAVTAKHVALADAYVPFFKGLTLALLFLLPSFLISCKLLRIYSGTAMYRSSASLIFQCVTLCYVVTGFFDFFFAEVLWLSRGALVGSYALTLGAMLYRHADRTSLSTSMGLGWSRGAWLRVVADALILVFSFTLALILRHFVLISIEGYDASTISLPRYLRVFSFGLLFLIPTCLLTYSFLGIYSRGRTYQSKFKALIVIEGVVIGYLLAGFLGFFFTELVSFSRAAFAISFALTLSLMLFSRLWATLWRRVIHEEASHESKVEAKDGTPRRILVIGGAGYIGSALLPKLLSEGYTVRLLDLMLYGEEPIASVRDHANLEIVREDFRMVDTVVRAMRDVDSVVHLGAIVGDPACVLDEEYTKEINFMATKTIADIAKGQGVWRFVFASTCSVYGASPLILDEYSNLNPLSLYARTKLACERVLTSMNGSGFHPTILRFATVYGLSGRTRFDLVVNLLTARALFEKKITVAGGDQWRPFIHVDDAAKSILAVLQAPLNRIENEIFNVGSDSQNFTIAQVAEFINQEAPEAEIIDIPFEGEKRNYRVDFRKIHRDIGFAPSWTVPDGIRQVADAIRTARVKDYREPLYSNVTFLQRQVPEKLLSREREWLEKQLLLE